MARNVAEFWPKWLAPVRPGSPWVVALIWLMRQKERPIRSPHWGAGIRLTQSYHGLRQAFGIGWKYGMRAGASRQSERPGWKEPPVSVRKSRLTERQGVLKAWMPTVPC